MLTWTARGICYFGPGKTGTGSPRGNPEEYVFYIDGKKVWRSTAGGVSQGPEYLKLTEEIGKWGGDIQQAQLPDYFRVDCVRVFEMTP